MQDFFVGGAHRLHDPRYASKPDGFKGSFLSRFGFRTETSGTLRLRLHLVEQVLHVLSVLKNVLCCVTG